MTGGRPPTCRTGPSLVGASVLPPGASTTRLIRARTIPLNARAAACGTERSSGVPA
jgi:hypothetical protein